MPWGRRLLHALDRPGLRPAASLLASAMLTLRGRSWCRVSFQDGAWFCRHADGVIVDTRIETRTPALLETFVRDLCLLHYSPREGDVILDVGAGCGMETFVFSKWVGPRGRVVAIEPHPRTFRLLLETCRQNGLANVTALPVAATSAPAMVRITDDPVHVRNTVVDVEDGLVVEGKSIDEIAGSLSLGAIDLLKMNIEGAERDALRGARETLARTRFVCIACHDFLADRDGNEAMRTRADVRSVLEESGFEVVPRPGEGDAWLRDWLYGRRRSG